MTPEEYIKAYTRGCSNELVGGGYQRWLPVEDALAAVELARKEMKEPASEDLEKYKEFVASELPQGSKVSQNGEFTIDDVKALIKDAVKLGAQWQREQMMKGAVNGWVARDKDCDIAIFREAPTKDAEIGMWMPCKNAFIFPDKDEYPDVTWDSEPQKVKVIIIKE